MKDFDIIKFLKFLDNLQSNLDKGDSEKSGKPNFEFIKMNKFPENGMFPAEDDKNFTKTIETSETENHIIKKEVWTSLDGKQKFERVVHESKFTPEQASLESTIEELQAEKQQAIKDQNYEKAAILRDKISKLEKAKNKK